MPKTATAAKSKYKVREGARILHTDEDAATVGRERERILKKYGTVNNELIVKEAEPEDSALHHFLPWDDKACGDMLRRQRAATMLRDVVIVIAELKRLAERVYSLRDQLSLHDGMDWFIKAINKLARQVGIEE